MSPLPSFTDEETEAERRDGHLADQPLGSSLKSVVCLGILPGHPLKKPISPCQTLPNVYRKGREEL